MLRTSADLVEADLSRFFGIRYTDRWRFDEYGQRKLTLREIWVRLQVLPNDSALVIAGNNGTPRWGHLEYLVSDLFTTWTQKQHPARPKSQAKQTKDAARERKVRAMKRKFAERNAAIESGAIA